VNEATGRYGLATALLRNRELREAEAEVDRLRALGVDSAMLDMLAARVKQAAGDASGAAAILSASTKRYPYSRAISYAHIGVLQDAGRNDAALAALREPLRLYPRDARLYGMQAKTYAALGKRLLQHQSQGESYALQGVLPAAIEQYQLARAAGDGDFYQLSVVEARLKELRAQHAAELKDAKK
jgi:beta-barrel assembly-enhancing protease